MRFNDETKKVIVIICYFIHNLTILDAIQWALSGHVTHFGLDHLWNG